MLNLHSSFNGMMSEAYKNESLKDLYQKQFSIETLVVSSEKRNLTVDNWIKWYDMKVVDETDTYTDLILG